MSGRLRVRAARRADAATIAAFQKAMAWETEGLSLDAPTVRRAVRRVFEKPALGRYWVAEAGGRVVGCLMTTTEWSDWRCRTILWIQSLYVVPESRGKGVFKELYARLKKLVLSSPAYGGIRLYVEQKNRRACRVYDAIGMRRDHYFMYEWMKPEPR